jgi:hypothetical protein
MFFSAMFMIAIVQFLMSSDTACTRRSFPSPRELPCALL